LLKKIREPKVACIQLNFSPEAFYFTSQLRKKAGDVWGIQLFQGFHYPFNDFPEFM
jgi:hypothetical protein